MPISQQRIESVYIAKLKSLKGLSVDFSEKPLVAIMGVNGAGKSTILHALACCYKPDHSARKDYKFTEFFIPNTYALWNDSDFTIKYSYRDGARVYENIEKHYQKRERWTPRYSNRPERYVSYWGISSCVPDIETDNAKSFVTLSLCEQGDQISNKILEACKFVLDIPYERLAICRNTSHKEYLGVMREPIGYCTSLSMGAGEQRVFRILSEAYKCPRYALLLIDEIDLLLHDNALRRLVQKLYEISIDRNLQVIFTTHSMLMTELCRYVCIRYLKQTPSATLCQTSISTDLIHQLTGNYERPIHIFVEDTLSKTIVEQISTELNCKRMVRIDLFGPAINAFTVIAGKVLNHENINTTLAVIDGDVYTTADKKREIIQSVITGQAMNEQRENALQAILQYNLPENQKPEMYIRNSILMLDTDVLPDNDEFRMVLEEIGVVENDHRYIYDAIRRLDLNYDVGLSRAVSWFSRTAQWEEFTRPIRSWLDNIQQII